MTPEQQGLLAKARNSLQAAKATEALGLYDDAASRAYYAMFRVAMMFLLERGLTFSKHSSVLSAFGQHFVKTGIIRRNFIAT